MSYKAGSDRDEIIAILKKHGQSGGDTVAAYIQAVSDNNEEKVDALLLELSAWYVTFVSSAAAVHACDILHKHAQGGSARRPGIDYL